MKLKSIMGEKGELRAEPCSGARILYGNTRIRSMYLCTSLYTRIEPEATRALCGIGRRQDT